MPRLPKDPLPWRPAKNGCSADVGTVFCVELTKSGWKCRMKPKRGSEEVLGEGLPSEAAARRVAQRTYTKSRKSESGGKAQEAPAAASVSRETEASTPPPAAELPKVSSEILEVDDGCLCGRVEGVRWVADRDGLVEFLRPVAADLVEKVRAEVAAHYQAKSKRPPARAARAAATPRKAGRGRKAESTPAEAPKRRGRKAESTPAEASKRRGRPPGSKNKPKPEPAKKAEEKTEAPVKKRRGRPPGSKNKPKAEKASGKSGAEEANEANGNGKTNGNGAATTAGQVLEWTEVGENFRAAVPSGYFEVVPEGPEYALYFADLNGASTFLKSGEKSTLMQVAAERNSRGMGAAPAAVASTNLDELFAQAIRG